MEALKKIAQIIKTVLGGDSEEGDSKGQLDFPDSLEAINELSKEDAATIAEGLNIEIDGLKTAAIKEHLKVVLAITTDDTEDLEKEEVDALAKAVGVPVKKNLEDTVDQLKDYFTSADEEEEEKPAKSKKSKDDEDEEEDGEDGKSEDDDNDDDEEDAPKAKKSKKSSDDEDEDDDEPKSKKKASKDDDDEEDDDDDEPKSKKKAKDDEEEESDEIDYAKIAKKAKVPKESIMTKRLEAFNEAAEEDDQIEIDEDDVEASYRKLLERCIDHEGNVIEWGTPYIAKGAGWCCGIELEVVKIKGKKESNRGKCLVTDKVFDLNDENEFEEVEDEE